jgi:hypothetical protein
MVELTHDKNFIAKLSQSFRGINQAEVKAFYSVLDPGGFVHNLSNNAADPGTKNRSFVNTRVDFFNRRIKGSLYLIVRERISHKV